jgi:tetraacyldisaccharide 4'-kinase
MKHPVTTTLTPIELEKLKGCRVAGVCGVGNPYAFWRTLTDLGAEILDFTTYPDHCEYNAAEVDSVLIPRAQAKSAAAIVLTEKDAVKLTLLLRGVNFPIWALEVRFDVFEGEEALWQAIQKSLS